MRGEYLPELEEVQCPSDQTLRPHDLSGVVFLHLLFVHVQVFIIGPDKRLKLSLLYPATTGRNFDEILRVVDSLQTTAAKRVATPADWKVGHP